MKSGRYWLEPTWYGPSVKGGPRLAYTIVSLVVSPLFNLGLRWGFLFGHYWYESLATAKKNNKKAKRAYRKKEKPCKPTSVITKKECRNTNPKRAATGSAYCIDYLLLLVQRSPVKEGTRTKWKSAEKKPRVSGASRMEGCCGVRSHPLGCWWLGFTLTALHLRHTDSLK